jgi:prepilin-type N-terminal cleavage/methylation domain-containing protein
MKRSGFTLIEMSAAITVLATCFVAFAYLVALTASERTYVRTRQTAVDQMQNVLERLAIVPPEKLAAGDFDKTAAESLIERSLPEGKIVFDAKIEPEGVVFTVTVSWSDGEKRPRREVAMFRLLDPSRVRQ